MPASVAALGLVTRLWGWEGHAAQKPDLCFLLCVFLEVFFQGRNETENIQDASHTLGHKKLTHLVDGSPAPVSWKQPWALETQRFLGDDGWLGGPAGRAHCPQTPWSLPALGPPSTGPCSPIRTKDAALQRRSAPPGPWAVRPRPRAALGLNMPPPGLHLELEFTWRAVLDGAPGCALHKCQYPLALSATSSQGFSPHSNTATGQLGPRVSPARAHSALSQHAGAFHRWGS